MKTTDWEEDQAEEAPPPINEKIIRSINSLFDKKDAEYMIKFLIEAKAEIDDVYRGIAVVGRNDCNTPVSSQPQQQQEEEDEEEEEGIVMNGDHQEDKRSSKNGFSKFFVCKPCVDETSCISLQQFKKEEEILNKKRHKKKSKKKKTAKNNGSSGASFFKRSECRCDNDPYCLVSLGGIMNEVLERRRPLEQLVADDSADKDDVINEQINTSMYSPSRGNNNLLSTVRKSISVSMEDITHYYTSNNICQNETEAIEFIGHLKRYHRSILYHSIVSKDDECEKKKDDDSVLLSQPPGMINLGATCYLNSQIQCLAQIINFRQGVLSWNSPSQSHQPPALLFDPSESTSDSVSATTPSSIMNDEQGVPAVGINAAFSNLQLLLAKLEHAPGNTIDTRMLATSLNLLESEMQDPNEFSRLFLDRVMDLCPELKDLLKKLFGGEVRYETKCQSCGMTRYRRETFMELTLPLPENVNNKSGKKRSTVKFDVSVQDCLDDYLIPEKLHSENQYECSRCRGKRDAERTLCFASLPPVLQIQLNKYVFDIQRNVKRKRMEEVRLPRELKINVCNHQQENTNKIEEYILCGVLHHLGTSAYGGHYIAEAMDWTTGTWFEFNDKDVKILPDGPTGSYFLENDKGRKIKGSADAYSMFYVEKGHLAKMVQNEFNERNCSSSSVVVGDTHKHTNCAIVDQIIKERITEYEKITKLQDENLSHASKMKERREKVLTNMFPPSVPLFIDSTSPNLKWVDGVKLREFLSYSAAGGSCSPIDVTGTNNSSPSSDKRKTLLLSHSQFLCEHGKKGLHPRVARKGKILSEEMYQKYLSILSEEYYNNEEESSENNVVGFEFTDKMIDPSCDIYCEECASSYQKELREKFTILTTSLEIFDNLQESTTSATAEDRVGGEKERRFAVAAKFLTDLKRYMMKKFNLVLKDKSVQAEGIDKIFFSELIHADKVMETGGEPIADPFVNKRIICPHGKLKQTNNKRTTKIVSEETWNNILSLFPNAISVEWLEGDGNNDSPPICEECIKESELERIKQENAAAERKANRKTNAAKQTKQLSNKNKETTNDQTNDSLIVEILDMVDLTIYQLDATVDVHDMACSEAKQIVSHLIANQGLFHHTSSAVGHSSFAAPRRRSTRKRKSQGHSSFYKVRFKRTQNLGAVRLMLYEQHNKSPLNQALFLAVLYTPESGTFYNMDENMYESSPPPYKIIELPFMWNDRSFEDILLDSEVRDGHNPRGFSDEVGVNNNLDLMYSSVWLYLKYDDEASEFVDGGGKMSKQEREEIEESILNSLLIYDDQSTSSSKDGTGNSNNKKRGRKRRAEKGFSGTALESCIPPSKKNNIVEIDVDSNNAETATIPVSEQDELKSSDIKRGSVFEPIEVES